tara:strand:+ start:1522 stop:2049 length:528 start_codon:yes stop_codon:yes gene_type:complete
LEILNILYYMNKLYKYILSIIFGIILYIIDNIINTFSIGIPPKRPPHFCAGYVNTDEDVDSDSDDDGYETANSDEPSETVGYLFQGHVVETDPIGHWYFTTQAPPYHNPLIDIEGNTIIQYGGIHYISHVPTLNVINTTIFFDPNTVYEGMNNSFNDFLNVVIQSSIYNLNYSPG